MFFTVCTGGGEGQATAESGDQISPCERFRYAVGMLWFGRSRRVRTSVHGLQTRNWGLSVRTVKAKTQTVHLIGVGADLTFTFSDEFVQVAGEASTMERTATTAL